MLWYAVMVEWYGIVSCYGMVTHVRASHEPGGFLEDFGESPANKKKYWQNSGAGSAHAPFPH